MKLAIVGLGRRMNNIVRDLRKAAPELRVVGLVDDHPENSKNHLTEEERAEIKLCRSVDELVAECRPDALAIGTRCDSHTRYAIEASRHSIPLFLEKPVSNSMEQAMALEQAFASSRCPVLVSFPLRVSTLCERTKTLLEGGTIGRLEHLLAVNYVSYGNVYFDTWHRDYSVTQGLFLQKATHDFDYLSYLVGAPITRVAAMASWGRVYRDTRTKTAHPDPNSIYLDEIGTPKEGMNEDSSSALLEFANGVKGVYTQVFFSKNLPRRGVSLSGMKGNISFDWYDNRIVATHHTNPFKDVMSQQGADNHFGGDTALSENFIAMVRENAPSRAPISAGIESVYACLAAKESTETGQFVNVRQLGNC